MHVITRHDKNGHQLAAQYETLNANCTVPSASIIQKRQQANASAKPDGRHIHRHTRKQDILQHGCATPQEALLSGFLLKLRGCFKPGQGGYRGATH